jgi:AraC-like DNA-binding protein
MPLLHLPVANASLEIVCNLHEEMPRFRNRSETMIVTELCSEDLPVGDRLEWWKDMCSRVLTPTTVTSDHANDFWWRIRRLDLGGLKVSALSYSPLHSCRTALQVRQTDPELYQLALMLRGRHAFSQGRRDAYLEVGDLLLYDTSHPNDAHAFADDHGAAGTIVVDVPRTALPLPLGKLDPLVATRLPGSTGIGALLSQFLTGLINEPASYQPQDSARLGAVTLDLITALVAHYVDAAAPESHRQALMLTINAYIERNLGDVRLTPGTIAAAHHISVRYLHLLFQQQDMTISSLIRHRRLERCRRDLAEPLLYSRPIHAVAARWGFVHAAQFSRAFRATYGIRPSQYREAAHIAHRH